MAKIQPLAAAASQSPSDYQRSQRAYTVWMKSLVFNGNGCTVYGPDGAVAFRVDNYGCRGGREVFFMDRAGNALIRIRRKGFGVFRRWEVCRCTHNGHEDEESTPWFTVRRAEKGGAAVGMHGGAGTCYRVDGCCVRKSEYKVSGVDGTVVAEVARKQTPAGVVLGEDVLTLTVPPEADHLLFLGLVVVRGLINRSL
ncbi:protein LURP-one-related 11-like [Hordeum vulgare subsp. vulgare]|uniref:Protein LURP-one-related 11 n=1 Tax=Hordeum vulgare subsp. vulgare TaxID=112509 RepID=A0A8I6WVX6_HORVV|nr:protein LURP-one-related 11-like [Hordeum vulgare subsp. vulgare]